MEENRPAKNQGITLILCIFGGFFGAHHFYVGNIGVGIFYLLTAGGFGLGWLGDILAILSGRFQDSSNLPIGKELREKEIEKRKELAENEYVQIDENIFISEKESKLLISGSVYGFSQIIDCELIEDGTAVSKTEGISKADGIWGNKINTQSTTTQTEYCTELYINITTDDFKNPRIRLDCKKQKPIKKDSYAYQKAMQKAQNILSSLKIIISKNNEKYVENGTITKIEHKYVTEESISMQIEKLSQLHKEGILSEYEFEMKKKELLEKIN